MDQIASWLWSVRVFHIEWIDSQGVLQMLINLHDSSLVTASVAVVGCCSDVNAVQKYGVPGAERT